MNTPNELKPLLSRKSLAAWLDVSCSTLDRWNAAGLLPEPLRIGNTLRWRRDDILAWIDAKCPAGNPMTDEHDLRLSDVLDDEPIISDDDRRTDPEPPPVYEPPAWPDGPAINE